MKKSLILSIVMTLVLVISMSTATFAWYTANAKATATVGTISAATAGGDISVTIKKVNGANAVAADGASLAGYTTAAKADKTISPAAPLAAVTDYTAATTNASWETGSIGINADTQAEEYKSAQATGGAQLYYGEIAITNSSTTTVEVKVSATSTDTTGQLKILVFDDANVVLFGNAYSYGADVNGAKTGDVEAVDAGTAKVNLGQATKSVYFIAWFEGYGMLNDDMGKTADITFTFDAAV